MNIFGFAIFYFSIENLQGRIEESRVNLPSGPGHIKEDLVNLPSGRVQQRCLSGYRADPLNCHLFYHCEGYSYRTPLSCGILMFNDITKTCDWPTRVMQLRPECKDNYKLRRKAKTEDQMGRLDEGEIMRHFGGDIAINVIRQDKIKEGSGQRFDFRGKVVADSEPMIRIRKYNHVKRKMAPRRVRMLRRRLVKKYPTQGIRKNKNKGGRKQNVNIAQSPPKNQDKIRLEDSMYQSTNQINRFEDTKLHLLQAQNQIHRNDNSKLHIQQSENRIQQNQLHRFDDSKHQTQQPQTIGIHESRQRVTSTQTSFSSHTPMTVSVEKHAKIPQNTQVKMSPRDFLHAAKQLDTSQNGDNIDWLHNKIFKEDKMFNTTTTRDDITEVFKEQPRVRVLKDQPRIRIARPKDFTQPKIRIKTPMKGSKTRVFTPNFSIPAPRFINKEQPITLNDAFQKRAGTGQRIHSNVQVSSPTFGLQIKNRKYLETKNIREKEETNIEEKDDHHTTDKQDKVSLEERREIYSIKKQKQMSNINSVDSGKTPEDAMKIREEIKNEIEKMLEKAKVKPSNQEHISSCITYYLKCKISHQSKGPCLKEFNNCSGAQILLPDLYERN